ncbi:sulfate ABC transporter substrate-binding protein [Gracilibacillus alcaliphilus]|uniref:sulfate ABC transporter substrate-binding protein n=1 Tax=Gracilibacillus alcaliphilus TaxID=1401441 RepID=UPI00195EC634|nr:sulfate ABC transporter substrate-binding protein [Gracilibacillus alcaliphilus]MBM7677900.1 sulfate transport system substrate-binding protein [Gracilibacillus alcaliphilus]
MQKRIHVLWIGIIGTLSLLSACSSSQTSSQAAEQGDVTLTIGAYTVTKEAVQEIIPLFQEYWKKEHGQEVVFKESYEASGSQTRAILQGLKADIAILALEGDIDQLTDKGLITHDWKDNPYNGMVTNSVVALGVREDNPEEIEDWQDLTREGVEVLLPNPKTSGGAQWDVNAIYGAGLKQSEEQGNQEPEQARQLLADIYQNVRVLDKSGRASVATFEKGIGDVIVTYENELLSRNAAGKNYQVIVPNYTSKIENPAALIDKNVDEHGNRQAAEAFMDFLWSEEAQTIFAKRGFRPVHEEVAAEFTDTYIEPDGLFEIDYLGGWDQVRQTLYEDGAIWDQIMAEK